MNIEIDLSKHKYSNTVFDVCQEVNKEEPNIVLDCYHYDDWMMIGFNKLPFIIQNGKMQWGIDIHQVLLGDFCNTFKTKSISFHTYSHILYDQENRIKRARYEFEKAWKELRKNSRVDVSILDIIHFKKVVYHIPVSPMSFAQAVYQADYGSIDDYCSVFSCNKNDMISVLKCLGFSIVDGNTDIRIDHEYIEAMRRICTHSEELSSYMNRGRPSRVLINMAMFFDCLECFFRDRKDNVRLKLGGNAVPNELVRGEKEWHWEAVLALLVSVSLLIGTAYAIFYVVNYLFSIKGQLDIGGWNSAYSSFLGSACGAGISGFAAIVTSYLVINRNYKVDYHNERLSVLPVFRVICEECETQPNDQGPGIPIRNERENRSKGYYMTVRIKNIGKGTAFQVILKRSVDDWDSVSAGTFAPSDSTDVIMEQESYSNLFLEYCDIYHNKYIQAFQVSQDRGDYHVNIYQPDLIERTTRARYQQ